jgi:hypothetical protein
MLPRIAAFAALSAGVGMPAPAPTQAKYQIDQTLEQEIDASGAGGAREKLSFKTSSFVTVILADSAGGKAMRVVIDSVRGDSATPIPRAVLDSVRGAEFHGFLSRAGKPSGLEPSGKIPAAAQIQSLLSDFFPWVRVGLKAGQSWSDTTSKSSGSGPDSVTVSRISAYKAAASATRNSRKAILVKQDFKSSVSGTQPTPNGPAKIEGTGSGSGSYYVTPDGRYLGGSWQQQSSLRISGSFAPKPLPITVVQRTEVRALK